MKNLIHLLLLGTLLLTDTFLPAQLLPFRVNHKWGMLDREGKVLIPPKYDHIGIFKAGHAEISMGNKVGIISEEGRVVLPAQYERTRYLNDSLRLFLQAGDIDAGVPVGLWGMVNLNSGNILPPVFSEIDPFYKGYARIAIREAGDTSRRYGFVDLQANLVIPPEYPGIYHLKDTLFYVHGAEGWGIMDQHRKILVPHLWEVIRHHQDGTFAVEKEGKWGVLSPEGEELLPPVYHKVGNLAPGLYEVKTRVDPGYKNGRDLPGYKEVAGARNRKNEVVFEDKYQWISALSQGWFSLGKTKGYGFGRVEIGELYPAEYQQLEVLSESYLSVRLDSLWGIVSAEGKEVFSPRFEHISETTGEHFWVKENGFWGMINTDGKWIIPAEYEGWTGFQGEPLAAVRRDNLWGIINVRGELLASPQFDKVEFYGTVARAFKDGQEYPEMLYFDEAGNRSNQIRFIVRGKGNSDFALNTAPVNLNGNLNSGGQSELLFAMRQGWFRHPATQKWGRKDPQTGRTLVRPAYDELITGRGVTDFIGLCNRVKGESRISLATMEGKVLTAPIFYQLEIEDFAEASVARAKIGSKFTLVNTRGSTAPIRDLTWVDKDSEGFFRFNVGGRMTISEVRTSETLETPYRKNKVTGRNTPVYLHCVGGKWGLMNRLGKVVLDPSYHFLSPVRKQVLLFKNANGRWGAMNTRFKHLTEAKYDGITLIEAGDSLLLGLNLDGGSYGFIDSEGHDVIPPRYEKAGNFSEGLAPAATGGKWGFLDPNGNWVIAPQFDDAHSFSEGKAWVRLGKEWSLIDSEGSSVLKGRFRKVEAFGEGMAPVAERYLYGYLNEQGEYEIKPQFTYAEPFQEGFARVREGRRWGLLASDGKFLARPKYYRMSRVSPHLFAARSKKSIHLINIQTGEVIRTKAIEIGEFSEGRTPFRDGQYWGYLDSTGKVILKPTFTSARPFHEGMAAVRHRGKWGFIDKSFELAFEPIFRKVGDFSEGKVAVMPDHYWFYIEKGGEQIFEGRFEEAGHFRKGIAPVKSEGTWGYINEVGEFLTEGRYDHAADLSGGLGTFRKGDLMGLVNVHGSETTSPKFEEIGTFGEGLAPVKIRRQSGVLSLRGEEILPPSYDLVEAYKGLIRVEKDGNTGYLNPDGTWIHRPESGH